MGAKLRELRPSQVVDDCLARSLVAGAAGFLVFGSLQAGWAPFVPRRPSLAIVSGVTAVFLATFALLLAYYHRRVKLGICGGAIIFLLPWAVNLAWAKLCDLSLIYPVVGLVAIGAITLDLVHRKISGPQPEDEIEEELFRQMVEDAPRLTWMEMATRWCFLVGTILFLILLAR